MDHLQPGRQVKAANPTKITVLCFDTHMYTPMVATTEAIQYDMREHFKHSCTKNKLLILYSFLIMLYWGMLLNRKHRKHPTTCVFEINSYDQVNSYN